jgi:hypothetical protein
MVIPARPESDARQTLKEQSMPIARTSANPVLDLDPALCGDLFTRHFAEASPLGRVVLTLAVQGLVEALDQRDQAHRSLAEVAGLIERELNRRAVAA